MKLDKAYTMECPFVQRKCKAKLCVGWEKIDENNGFCVIAARYGREISEKEENATENK